MKKVIRLTESDLIRLVKRVINESSLNMAEMNKYKGITASDVIDCAKKNNFDLDITIPVPNDTTGIGNACKRTIKTKMDKDAMECVLVLSNSIQHLHYKPGFKGIIDCLKNKVLNNMGNF
jgi:hypothetical protein